MSINMSNHCTAFVTNEIDGECLLEADEDSLTILGVTLPMQRKKMLRKIQELFAPQGSFPDSLSQTPPPRSERRFHSQTPPLPQPVPTTFLVTLTHFTLDRACLPPQKTSSFPCEDSRRTTLTSLHTTAADLCAVSPPTQSSSTNVQHSNAELGDVPTIGR